MTKDDINWLVNLVDDRKKFADACRKCSECDIFDKCQEEHRNYCEKDEDNIMKENNENDLISRQNALDEIHRVYEYEFPTASGAFDEFVTMIIPNILRNLPSAYQQREAKVKWNASYGKIMSFRFEGICECGQEVDHLWDYCPSCGMKLE